MLLNKNFFQEKFYEKQKTEKEYANFFYARKDILIKL